jgi:hypothetical protein
MDLIYRNATPSYLGSHFQSQAKKGPLSGLLCNLLGGGTPSYKLVDVRGAQASTPARCWWQALVTTPNYKNFSQRGAQASMPVRSSWLSFVATPTPFYKTAPDTVDDSDACTAPDENQEDDAAAEFGCEVTQVVVL